MRMFICLTAMFVMIHFNIRVGFLGIFMVAAFFLALYQDIEELLARTRKKIENGKDRL